MNMIKSKKGFDVSGHVDKIILVILGIVVIFQLLSSTAGTLTTSADNLAGSGLPLAGLFGSSGIVILIFMVGIILLFVRSMLKKK